MKVNFRRLALLAIPLFGFLALAILLANGLAPRASAERNSVDGPFRHSVKPIAIHPDWAALAKIKPSGAPRIRPLNGRTQSLQNSPSTQPALFPDLAPLPPPPPTMPTPIQNFEAISWTNVGWPPDTNGDVGPNHYVQSVNSSFAVFNKTGGLVMGPVTFNAAWSGVHSGTVCDNKNEGDPISIYDPIADRWLITDFAFGFDIFFNPIPPFYECIFVSQTGDPTGAYWAYAIPANPDSVNANVLGDYPKFGMWRDGYYMTFNMFDLSSPNQSNVWARVFAFDREAMISGSTVYFFTFDFPLCLYTDTTCPVQSLLPANIRGALPLTDTPEYLANIGGPQTKAGLPYSSTNVLFWKLQVTQPYSTGTASVSGPFTVTVPTFTEPIYPGTSFPAMNIVPQSGTATKLDTLGDRMMYPLQYRRLPLQSSESLWATHTVSQSGHTAIRWYEFRVSNGSFSLFQSGTLDNNNDGLYRWMPSIAADQNGNMAVGYSVSGNSMFPGIRYTGRVRSDPPGQLPQGEVTLQNGAGSQTSYPSIGAIPRWGDYSTMSVDPADDCTFWYTQEYYTKTGYTWDTRVGSFKFNLGSNPVCTSGFPNKQFMPDVVRNAP